MSVLKRIYFALNKGSGIIERIIKVISSILVFSCFFAVFLQVFNRYVMVKQTIIPWESISWTDELARFLFVAIAYSALGMCYKHGQLSRADMVFSKLKRVPKKILYIFEFVLICIFLVVVCYYGIQFAQASSIYKSESLRIPGNILYLIPVIGFFLLGYQVITEFIGVISGAIEPFENISSSPMNIE